MKVGDLVKHPIYGMGIVARPYLTVNQSRWFVHWAKFPEIWHALYEWKLEVINESR